MHQSGPHQEPKAREFTQRFEGALVSRAALPNRRCGVYRVEVGEPPPGAEGKAGQSSGRSSGAKPKGLAGRSNPGASDRDGRPRLSKTALYSEEADSQESIEREATLAAMTDSRSTPFVCINASFDSG